MSWQGFLYCFDSKYIEGVSKTKGTDVKHRSVCTCKQRQILDILGNIEILARMRPGKMAPMVTLVVEGKIFLVFSMYMFKCPYLLPSFCCQGHLRLRPDQPQNLYLQHITDYYCHFKSNTPNGNMRAINTKQ